MNLDDAGTLEVYAECTKIFGIKVSLPNLVAFAPSVMLTTILEGYAVSIAGEVSNRSPGHPQHVKE